ncbi:WxcM-like domain-containing protein [Sorangium sp. So ce269]
MLFIRLLDFAPDTVVLVLASTHYDKSRSIRSWEDYLQEARGA